MIISSFSGGKTSAYMTYLLKKKHKDLKVVFMNTGLEHEETLSFVNKCDKEWNLNIDWIEAVVHHKKGMATGFRYVTYETCTRDNSIAKEIVKKYGLFGMGFLHCTRELKQRPFAAWKKYNQLNDYKTAIGIRSDEIDRVNPNYEKEKLFYPLLDFEIKKEDVNQFWHEQDFNLNLIERHGNCKMCWKKSDKKLIANLRNNPEWAQEIKDLEKIAKKGSEKMFRKNRNIDELLLLATSNLDMFDNKDMGCKSSCEVF